MGQIVLPFILMKKQFATMLAMVAILLPACTPAEPVPGESASSEEAQNIDLTESSSAAGMAESSGAASEQAASAKASAPTVSSKSPTTPSADGRTILMTVTNFKFEPSKITIKKGEKIKLQVTGVEGTHGLAIPDLGVNVSVAPGQTVTIDIPTTKTGTFSFFCSIPCGSGHRDMRGTIVIEE